MTSLVYKLFSDGCLFLRDFWGGPNSKEKSTHHALDLSTIVIPITDKLPRMLYDDGRRRLGLQKTNMFRHLAEHCLGASPG